jgi:hypothetical protein
VIPLLCKEGVTAAVTKCGEASLAAQTGWSLTSHASSMRTSTWLVSDHHARFAGISPHEEGIPLGSTISNSFTPSQGALQQEVVPFSKQNSQTKLNDARASFPEPWITGSDIW